MVFPRKSPSILGKKRKLSSFALSIPFAILLGLMWVLHHRVSDSVTEEHKQLLRPPPKFASSQDEVAYEAPPGGTHKKKSQYHKLPPPLHPLDEEEDTPAEADTPFRIFHGEKEDETEDLPHVDINKPPPDDPVIAYAISLVKCGDHQTNAAGLTDAALVLRHSIHMISSRNPESGSKYDYHMIAIVHRQALECSKLLETVGFEIMVVDAPIKPQEIEGAHLRKYIHKEWCCGHDEFIKWFPYKMTKFLAAVHVDIDFAFLKPMDELFDAIRFDKDSPEGQLARGKILRERPNEPLPDKIDAFFTKDWPQVIPGRKAGYQAGFVVVRPDPSVFTELTEIVKKGNFTDGFGRDNGWGGLGYGGFVGAMAMQGLMAYYYDHIRPLTSVELNQCRYNWMGMDVRYRAAPNFQRKNPKVGMCRNDLEECEDCTTTDLSEIRSVHYTECRKPWNCVGTGVAGGAKGASIDTSAGNFEKCMEVVSKWHELRADFELKLYSLSFDDRLLQAASQAYKKNVFRGHCGGEGGKNYTQIDASEKTFAMVPRMYAKR
mmetsp:Transcript_8915/g.14855  ORF Transcript_8915/g.14855 Transcript_8915/m.14855 type:complete len:546 (+) Transcript_8915:126-1763(+)